ncbi:unnamed protein product [Cuscuta epithymum]|uniref:Transmembrane protein n=1 Tax=Cuscuta epithymum TaxID=186058 RepID=A0AAV0CBN6_9ASTE|nr:unnamed protein product [Cuscuta epithymum]
MQTKFLFDLQGLSPDPNFFCKSSQIPRQSSISHNICSVSSLSHTLRCRTAKLSSQINVRRRIASVLKRKKKSGSSRSTKILLQSAYLVASNLKIFPEPFDSLIREFIGGNGGGGVFLKGYGGEGSGGRRSGKRNWIVIVMGIIVIVGLALSLALWKELDLDMVIVGLGLCLFLLSVNVWRRKVLDWVLGFCCCAFGGFVFNEDLQRGVKFLEAMKIAKRRKRRCS